MNLDQQNLAAFKDLSKGETAIDFTFFFPFTTIYFLKTLPQLPLP